MYRRSKVLFGIFAYFYLISAFHRFLFLLANQTRAKDLPVDFLLLIVQWSCSIDIITALSLAVIPGVVICVQPFAKVLRRFLKAYLAIASVVLCAIGTADLIIYGQWGKRFGADALDALGNAGAILANFSPSLTLRVALQFVPSVLVLAFVLAKSVFPAIDGMPGPDKNRGEAIVVVPIHLAACLVAVFLFSSNGQDIFVNEALGYQEHSDFVFGISARQNPFHHFLNYILPTLFHAPECNAPQFQRTIDPGEMLQSEEASARRVLRNGASRPHVVLVIGESFSSDVVDLFAEGRGDGMNLTPEFDALAAEGMLFSNFYASRYGTPRALNAILTGFPLSVRHGDSAMNLAKELKWNGYATRFYYGGDLEMFGDREGLAAMGFGHVMAEEEFSASANDRGRWGVYDHVVFENAFQDMKERNASSGQPSFNVILTLSYHIPFNVPAGFKCDVRQPPSGFSAPEACGVRYADASFARFIRRFQEDDSWKDTLVVFVADHGRHGSDYSSIDRRRFKIPMLWLGGALDRASVGGIDAMGSQCDLAATLLRQLDIDPSCMKFSRDILAPHMDFAFYDDYVMDRSIFGVVQGDRYAAFSCETGSALGGDGFEKSEEIGWTYIQMLLDYRKELEARIDQALATGVGDRCVEAKP